MIDNLITTLGVLWAAALCAEILAVVCEVAGEREGPDGKKRKHPIWIAVPISLAAICTNALLFTHAYIVWRQTTPAPPNPIVAFLFTPASVIIIFATFIASVVGWIIAASVKPARPLMHAVSPTLVLLAFTLALTAAWKSLPIAWEGLQTGSALRQDSGRF